MKDAIRLPNRKGAGRRRARGVATFELAILLPLMLVILFVIVDFGRLIDARFAIAKVAQQGGLLGSRDLPRPNPGAPYDPMDLITLLQQNTGGLDLADSLGRIYVWRVAGGTGTASAAPSLPSPFPNTVLTPAYANPTSAGGLPLALAPGSLRAATLCSDLGGDATSGLCGALTFDSVSGMATLSEVTVVEVYYKYEPITPISRLIAGLLTRNDGGFVISTKAVFP